MDSPPRTPPSSYEGESRFEEIISACEFVEDYRPGGFHPIDLGNVLKDGRYKIIRKLGEGSFSTVWLARDLRHDTYVGLKIVVSKLSKPLPELKILHHLTRVGFAAAEAAQFVPRLLDEFMLDGPNGTHTCLVFEPMGPTVNSMVEELPEFKSRMMGLKVRYPSWMAKGILRQSLQALAFLHRQGIAHGDFQPGNMLFCLRDINSEPEDALRQHINPEGEIIASSPTVKRLDGKQDRWAPRHLYVAQPLVSYTNYDKDFRIKLSDMGGAFFFTNPPAKSITPDGLRPPELVLAGEAGKTLDIWSFGCLLFELLTGQPLFCVPWMDGWEDDSHLLNLTAKLGPLPEELFKRWKTSYLYFTPERKLFNCHVGGVPETGEPLMLPQTTMEEAFDETDPGLSKEEARNAKALIRRILQYDPAKRPSAEEILEDPFFC